MTTKTTKTKDITLVEVGPRDGLQNEPGFIETQDKVKLVDLLSDCGLARIEVTSFVSPRWVPQMRDAAAVMARIRRKTGVIYSALTPNLTGFNGAMSAQVDEVAIFAAASESFSQKNINCSIEQSLHRFGEVVAAARDKDVPVRAYISCVTHCPYEGAIAPEAVARVSAALLDMGCYQIVLGETIGVGTPGDIEPMLDAVTAQVPVSLLAGHYHDTNGRAIENIAMSLGKGLTCFDAAVGGLGGCPYAPGAKGNVASEAVISYLHGKGYRTGVDEEKLARASAFARSLRTDAAA